MMVIFGPAAGRVEVIHAGLRIAVWIMNMATFAILEGTVHPTELADEWRTNGVGMMRHISHPASLVAFEHTIGRM
jgi:hypothetical protein